MPIHDWTRVIAGTFHDFHATWIVEIKRALNAGLLPPDYYAMLQRAASELEPDVPTRENAPFATSEAEWYARKRKAVAIHRCSSDQVVAVIYIVSPGNRYTRNGLRSFVNQAVASLKAGIHLLVIDLLPPTSRDAQGIHGAIWSDLNDGGFCLPQEKPLTLAAYSAGEEKAAYIEPVAVGDALPDMPLFLEPDRYVNVPLEATYRAAFDAVPRRWRDELEPLSPS